MLPKKSTHMNFPHIYVSHISKQKVVDAIKKLKSKFTIGPNGLHLFMTVGS